VGTFAVDGTDLVYDVRGDGPCVVFVHGTGTHRLTFEPVLDALPAGHALVTYDRRGFGASRGTLARRMSQHADDLTALIEHLSRGPATVVAQSGGAVVALQLAASHPELVDLLILAEPVVQLARFPSFGVLGAMSALQARRALGRRQEAVAGFYRWASGRRDGTSSWDTVPEEWSDVALEHAEAVFREIRQMMVPIPSSRVIGAVACPTAVVIGDVGPPVFHRTTRRVARLIPQSRTMDVPDSGHLIAVDQPVAFAAAVADVLGS
jgi:3-oxoadipate enol-lactonase